MSKLHLSKFNIASLNANHSVEFPKQSSATIIMDKCNGITTFDELIEVEHGKIGTDKRNVYEQNAQMFYFCG